MALSCSYAASGKNAGSANRDLPVVTASHRSWMALRNATDFVLGKAWVCLRRPAPGATGSALGDGGAGGFTGTVSEGVATACVGVADVPLAVERTGRAWVWAGLAEQPASIPTRAAKPTTPRSRHLMDPVCRLRNRHALSRPNAQSAGCGVNS